MLIGKKEFYGRTYIMGILNTTPDSFSDGGRYTDIDAALFRAEQMANEGADVIDIGGESTRPGYTPVSAAEETERTAPVIAAVKARLDIPVSIDTYKPSVCEAALQAGADMVNDIWGFENRETAVLTSRYGASCCLMHNRKNALYDDFFNDVKKDLSVCVNTALSAGIPPSRIMTDPGIGFAKNYEQNMEAIRRCPELKALGYPVLLGASRKSVIGLTLGTEVGQRLEGTLALTAYAVMNGLLFVRVHDIAENKRLITMLEAVTKGEKQWIK